ncbi:hypothetical protein ACFL3E_00155 [Patescibacteria group bacterium]
MKFIFTLIFIAGGIGLLWGIAMPQWEEVSDLRDEFKELEDVNERVRDVRASRDDLLKRYNDIPLSKIELLDLLIPKEVKKAEVLIEIDDLTSKYGLVLKNLTFSDDVANLKEKNTLGFRKLNTTFSFLGSYASFRAFLDAVERNIHLTEVDSINITSSGEGVLLNFSMRIHNYYGE